MPRHRLRDATWASLHAKLVTIPGIWKTDAAALRRFVEAVVYVLRAGIAWEDLPATFGTPGTAYRRFRRWACKGIWDELFLEGVPTDALETVMLDSSACKAQRFASGARGGGEEALGRSRGGLTTEIHAVVGGGGRGLCFLVAPRPGARCPPAPGFVPPARARPGRRLPAGPGLARGLGLRATDRRPRLRHRRAARLARGGQGGGGRPLRADPEGG